MSSRLQRMLAKDSLLESVGGRSEGHEVVSSIDVSGADINEGRYRLRECSMVALRRIIPDPDQPRTTRRSASPVVWALAPGARTGPMIQGGWVPGAAT